MIADDHNTRQYTYDEEWWKYLKPNVIDTTFDIRAAVDNTLAGLPAGFSKPGFDRARISNGGFFAPKPVTGTVAVEKRQDDTLSRPNTPHSSGGSDN